MLNIDKITYSYGRKGRPVLSDYSLSVSPGTICGLLGRNGAGKSTLLYLICGLLRAQAGTVSYNGYNPAERKTGFLNDVFLVPEEYELPDVTLREYIGTTAPFYPKFSHEHLRRHLETFELDQNVHLGHLSMGQKKRVFMSFALACNTSLLLMDEPTNGLDIPGKRLFRKAVLNGMDDHKTIIISTHQVFDVEKILDHVVITDTSGVLVDMGINDLTSRFKFLFTTDRYRAQAALVSLDTPGGYNIIEVNTDGEETEVNLETLFELVSTRRDDIIL